MIRLQQFDDGERPPAASAPSNSPSASSKLAVLFSGTAGSPGGTQSAAPPEAVWYTSS